MSICYYSIHDKRQAIDAKQNSKESEFGKVSFRTVPQPIFKPNFHEFYVKDFMFNMIVCTLNLNI